MIKDSGERTQFESGAQRDCQEGKGRMDLLPYRALIAVSRIFEEGAKKHDANNWRKGIPLSRYADSGQRHFAKWMIGMRDEPHLEQACWNLLCLIETSALIEEGQLPAELNDLPYHTIEQKNNPLGVPPLKFPGCKQSPVSNFFTQEEIDAMPLDMVAKVAGGMLKSGPGFQQADVNNYIATILNMSQAEWRGSEQPEGLRIYSPNEDVKGSDYQ